MKGVSVTTRERSRFTPEQVKQTLDKVRSDPEHAREIERGFEQVDRGEYVTIEIDEENKTYRVIE